MDNQKLWHKFLETIKPQISPANFRTFFSKTTIESLKEDKITLTTPSAFIKETLNQRHLALIESVLEQTTGKKLMVELVVNSAAKDDKALSEEDIFQPEATTTSIYLNPKYTLENFVVGPSNNVAYAAALAIVQNPGTSYNPLFIYGGTGVGKTHLMLAIGNAILKKNSHLKIIYAPSEKFTNDYVEAIQTRKMGDLRNKYRSTHLLLVDDIQFFSGREGTQEEFFHTFNELQAKNAQIILTSDRAPFEISKLEDRLKSRFQGGLMVDIQLPDFDTRVAILKAKCLERGEVLPEECFNIIASYIETNARELEGKLIQILQFLKTQNLTPTPEVVRTQLGQKPENTIALLNHKQVLSTLCQYFNITLLDLTGPKRQKELVLPRHLAMHILSEDLKMTVEKIGEVLGGRDHTTVIHGRDKVKRLITQDREVQKIYIEVKQSLANSI